MNTNSNTYRTVIAVMMITTTLALVGCSNAANMAADFPCDYTAQVDEFTTGETLPFLGDIVDATFPEWYMDDWSIGNSDEYRTEWSRLILARNGFSEASQVEPDSTIKIPARCEDLGGSAKPQSSD